MLPRWHIFLGFLFSLLIAYLFPSFLVYEVLLVFFASFLIDFDHYLVAAIQTKRLSLFSSFEFYKKLIEKHSALHKRGIRNKGFMMIFHTLEFHVIVLLIGIFLFRPFLFIFIGMAFHSLCDILYLYQKDILYHRHFLLTPWIKNTFKKRIK